MFHPLVGGSATDGHEYLISIQTAMRPFSGSNTVPLCIVVGEQADSGVRELRSEEGLKVGIIL